jgi:hypothetical protein
MGIDIGKIARSVGDAFTKAAKEVGKGIVNKAVDAVTTAVAKQVDKFEPQLYAAGKLIDGIAKLVHGREQNADKQYDGKLVGANGKTYEPGTPLDQISGTKPSNGKPPAEKIIFVNGIGMPLSRQQATMQTMADKTGAEVVGLHNATEGFITDLAQCAGDKVDKGKNAAVDSLAETVYQQIRNGEGVHLLAHSQGALITSRALTDVKNRLMLEDGMSPAQAEKALSGVKVETFGGAAASFPDGPQYVHYVNRGDAVPTMLGLGSGPDRGQHPGKGAVMKYFNDFSLNLGKAHNIDTTYLDHRVPFDQARAEG